MKIYQINEFEKIVSEDLNDSQKSIHQSLYDKILYPFFQKQNGVLGESFAVSRDSATVVTVKAGRAFYYDGTQEGVEPKYRAIQLLADIQLTIGTGPWAAAPGSPNNRWDIIVIRPKEEITLTSTRYIKTAGTGPIQQETVDKVLEQLYEIDVVEGTAGGAPTVPATPAGWLKIAEVFVTGGTGIASSNDVIDSRNVLLPAVQVLNSFNRFVSPSGNGTDTSLAAAISNLPVGGGSILILEDITIDSSLVIPANSSVSGMGPGTILSFEAGGQIDIGTRSVLRDMTIYTEESSVVAGLVDMVGNYGKIQNIIFDMQGTGSTAVVVNGEDCDISSCTYLECDENGPNTSFVHNGYITGSVARDSIAGSFDRVIEINGGDSPYELGHQESGALFLVSANENIDIQLPAAPKNGMRFAVKDKTGGFGTYTVKAKKVSTELVEGVNADYEMSSPFGYWEFFSFGGDWYIKG